MNFMTQSVRNLEGEKERKKEREGERENNRGGHSPDHAFKKVVNDEVRLSHNNQQSHMCPSKLLRQSINQFLFTERISCTKQT